LHKNSLSVVRETYGKVVYTHKTYEKAADITNSKSKWVKRINIFLLSLTSGSAIGALVSPEIFIMATSILATFSLFFSVYQYNFNYEALSKDYKDTAQKLWLIREKYQNFIADILSDQFDPEIIAGKRDSLLNELNQILACAPPTFPKAYSEARKSLKIEEEMTFSSEEIDNFLPEDLRSKK